MDPLRKVLMKDSRYRPEAYQFLYEALEKTVQRVGKTEEDEDKSKHISGQELLDGMRVHATQLFGPLAAQVWRTWGVKDTIDWGRIVFNLVEGELLRRQETDTVEDFRDGYDFDEVFVRGYVPALPDELGAVPRSPAQDVELDVELDGGAGETA